jgi:hypothetical protein
MREQDQFALQITSLNAAPPSSNAARWAASSSLVSIQLLTIFQKVRQGRRQVQDGVAKRQPIRSAPLDAGPEHQWSTQSEVSASVDWLGLLSVMVLPTRGVNNALTLPTDFMASARP